MKAALVTAFSLLALALLPAAPVASATCVNTGSQWAACYQSWCATVDGPALHAEKCIPVDELIADFCVQTGSQWAACVAYPCLIVDGPALHKEVCLKK